MADENFVVEVKNLKDFQSLISDNTSNLVVVHFTAPWSEPCKDMNNVMKELAKNDSATKFVTLEAEALPQVCIDYEVAAVPTFIFIKNKKALARIDGAKAAELTSKVKQISSKSVSTPAQPQPPKEDLNVRLKKLVNAAPVILFMKGTPEEPRCGFSKQTIKLLNDNNIEYSTFNILTDEEVRQGLKKFSDWPTYPQLYHDGELLGGLDILKELIESGDITLPKLKDLNTRLKELTTQSPVMLFMKGDPETPKCGFSRKIIDILNNTGVTYDTFDILTDEEVRQGLKTFSNWPTFPQLYVKGEFIGGLDIITELESSGELQDVLSES